MGRKHVVKTLSEEQFDFVMRELVRGETDRGVCAAFEKKFGQPLAKSSLGRWRKAAGDQLIEKFKIARFQAHDLVSASMEKQGPVQDDDYFKALMKDIESQLLVGMHEYLREDPLRALSIRQRDKEREVRAAALQIRQEVLAMNKERLRCEVNEKSILAFMKDLLEFVKADPEGLKFYKKIARGFTTVLKKKYAVPKV